MSGEPEQARAQLEAIARSFPDDRDLLLARSRLARNLGQIGEAAQYLDRLRALFPDDVQVRVAQVELDLEGGDVARGLKYAEELVARFPEDLVALETLGRAQVVAGRPGDARVTFRRMSDRVGFDARWQVRIAAHQRSVAADDDARHSLTKAVQADPSFAAGQRDLAVLELQTGHPDRARELAEKMLETAPEDLVARQIEADALLALGQAEAARSAYRMVFEQEPNLPRALGLARAEALLGNPSAAADILAGWYSQHPEDDFAGLALAEFRSQAGERQVAIGIYEQLLVRNPESPAVLNNLAQLLAGEENTRALELARKAVELAPGDPNLLDTLGWLLVSTDAAEEGLRYLREARSREAGNPTHAYHLAVALERLGRIDEARRTLEPTLASAGDFPEREDARALVERLSGDRTGDPAETGRHKSP
jgi:cellulose synthase operon protein C